jgi:PAS domain S-box-containing protein
VLIVEDERIVAADLQARLEELGYEVVDTADTGPRAVACVEQNRPDLVLMDIQIRGPADGITVANELRRRWQIPVVFITANANDATIARARETAPYGYLLKPLRPKELNAALLIALHQYRLTRELFAEHNWLRTTMASLSDGVIATDAQGFIRYLNPVAEHLTGWALDDAIGKTIEEVYPLNTTEGTLVERCQLRKALESAGPVPKELFVHLSRNGRAIPVEDSAAPVLDTGKLAGAVTVFRDITDRLRREREQELERDHLEEQFQATNKALDHTRAELRALSQHLMTAQEEERRRVARANCTTTSLSEQSWPRCRSYSLLPRCDRTRGRMLFGPCKRTWLSSAKGCGRSHIACTLR